jgi:hypothetical protein
MDENNTRAECFCSYTSADGGCVVTGTGALQLNSVHQKHGLAKSYSTNTIDCNDIMRSADGNFLICGGDRVNLSPEDIF